MEVGSIQNIPIRSEVLIQRQRSQANPFQESVPASVVAITDKSQELAEFSGRNKENLEQFSSALVEQYSELINGVGTDESRLDRFVKGVDKVFDQLQSQTEKNALTLKTGESVTFSLSGHLEAVYAASVNNEVSVSKLDVEFKFEAYVAGTSNEFDFAENGGEVVGAKQDAVHPPLFLTRTISPPSGGFPELGLFDRNGDGRFNSQDILPEKPSRSDAGAFLDLIRAKSELEQQSSGNNRAELVARYRQS